MRTFFDIFAQGGQTQLHKFHMIGQVLGKTFQWSLLVTLLIYGVWVFNSHSLGDLWNLLCYGKAFVRMSMDYLPKEFFDTSFIFMNSQSTQEVQDSWIVTSKQFARYLNFLFYSLKTKLFWSTVLGVSIFLSFSGFWVYKGKKRQNSRLISGQTLVNNKRYKSLIGKDNQASTITLAGVPLAKESEQEHTLIVGTTGTGKTNAVNELLQQIRARGDKAIIVDVTGEYVEKFYNDTQDILLNPLDGRSANWSLWKECTEPYLYDQFAESFIPGTGHDPFWTNAARMVLSCTAKKLQERSMASLKKLLHLTMSAPLPELYSFLKGTPAAGLMDPSSDKTALSIRATMIAHAQCLNWLEEQVLLESPISETFSLKEWIQKDDLKGFTFITCTPDQRSALRPLMSAWVSFAIHGLLARPMHHTQKIWIIIDELAALQELLGLIQGLAEVRKYGGCFVLGVQTLSQIEEIYKASSARSIGSLTGTKLIFRTPDSQTAKRMSELLGEQEIIEPSESISYGAHQMRDGVNLSDQRRQKPVVPYTEIMNLQNLEAFLQVPRNVPVTKVTFTYHDLPSVAKGFVGGKHKE